MGSKILPSPRRESVDESFREVMPSAAERDGGSNIAFALSSLSGLGHTARAVAILAHLRALRVTVAAHRNAHDFIRIHFDRIPCAVEIVPLHYGYFDERRDPPPASLYGLEGAIEFKKQNLQAVATFKNCGIVVNDFLRQGPILNNGGLLVGLYHSSLNIMRGDDVASRFWKRRSRAIAEASDLFVHTSPDPSFAQASIQMNVPTIFVPLIVRGIYSCREQVLHRLGLTPEDRFFLVHNRGLDKERHVLSEVADAADRIGLQHKVVLLDAGNRGTLLGHECVAEADLVVTKPGMGILSECLAYGTPLVFCPDPNPERVDKVRLLRSLRLTAHDQPPVRLVDAIVRTWETRAAWRRRRFKANGAEMVAFLLARLYEANKRYKDRPMAVRAALEATAMRWLNQANISL